MACVHTFAGVNYNTHFLTLVVSSNTGTNMGGQMGANEPIVAPSGFLVALG